MKFVIESKELKDIVKRASVLCNEKSINEISSIYIDADEQTNIITVKALDLESYVTIKTGYAKVYTGGHASAYVKEINKLLNIQGEICVECIGEKISVKNTDKKSEICNNGAWKNIIEFPKADTPIVFTAGKLDLINTFNTLYCCTATDMTRPVLSGYYVDSLNKRITACDSYKIAYKKVNWNFVDMNVNIIIPRKVSKELKEIAVGKNDENISVSFGSPSNEKFPVITFIGSDFQYSVRVIAGEYINVDNIMKRQTDIFNFKINKKQLYDITKEYVSVSTEANSPMYFGCNGGKMIAIAMSERYNTSDVLKIEYEKYDYEKIFSENKVVFCCNTRFLKDIIGIFDSDEISVQGSMNALHAWFFENENYVAMILPVRAKDVDRVNNFLLSM